MKMVKRAKSLNILLVLALLLGLLPLIPLGGTRAALANPGKMIWSIITTPASGLPNNIIVSPSEINSIAIGGDATTLYAVDVASSKLYKSVDGGATWPTLLMLNNSLVTAGAKLPVWNMALAPDDVNFVVAITDGAGPPVPNGPKEVFISINGGTSWDKSMTGLSIGANEYISCIDVSAPYADGQRDVAIGTRNGVGTGKVWGFRIQAFATGWKDQALAPAGDVTAIKFSPTYAGDSSLVVISTVAAPLAGTFLNLGFRDVVNNTTIWKATDGYPVPIVPALPGTSPKVNEIIAADLELPADFVGSDPGGMRRYYVNTDAIPSVQSGVYRIDNNQVFRIKPPTNGRISSIAYFGAYTGGNLLAGEVNAISSSSALVNVWRCIDPIDNPPAWLKSDQYKSPTGGGNDPILTNPGYANAQVAWNPNGAIAYCGTSSANLSAGGTAWVINQWPRALLTTVALDESAFSISPYSPQYKFLFDTANKAPDTDVGNIWDQTGLIDTDITQFSDVAALEVPKDSKDYNVLYLASVSTNTTFLHPQPFDSVWRSTGTLFGFRWERILCSATAKNDIILRVNPRTATTGGARSNVLVFADRDTNNIIYSLDEGHLWQELHPSIDTAVKDITLASDDVFYVLDNASVRRVSRNGIFWIWKDRIDTGMDMGHTITTPLNNPTRGTGNTISQDFVIVGDETGKMAYADFSQVAPVFEPSPLARVTVPEPGKMHVIADDKFEQNKIIYAASDLGKIYRWTIGTSTTLWDELGPPNSNFYGLEHRNDVLYGLWDIPATPPAKPGADRTLYSMATVPPPIEWDSLIEGLPKSIDANYAVAFTREPSSLKVSEDDYGSLWAIDNRTYDWTNKRGCLWAYTDLFAKVGPYSYAPASGDVIPVDPVTGRASEINFAWHDISYATGYELQIAKDEAFSIRVFSDNVTPVDQTAPAAFYPAGGIVLIPASEIARSGNIEAGHKYYWRVRANRAVSGETVHSPWSSTLFFTIEAGLPVRATQIGLTLFQPRNGARGTSQTPAFSWSSMPRTTKYEFILSKDAVLLDILIKAQTKTTAYQYDGKLDPGTTYYWQVRPLEPVPGDPSPVSNFTIAATIETKVEQPREQKTQVATWIWPVIVIWVILIIALIVFANTKPAFVSSRIVSDKLKTFTGESRNRISSLLMKIRRIRYWDRHKDDPQNSE